MIENLKSAAGQKGPRGIARLMGSSFLGSAALVLSMLPVAVAAQDSGTSDEGSAAQDEVDSGLLTNVITVTANKREQDGQDVGIAITAFSGEQIDKIGVVESTDIAGFTAGVSISGSFAGQQKQFTVRGVTQNDFNDHVEAPNAVYIDEAYVAAQQGQVFATFDLDRVEVLKGPQGTLFGRNATGGLIHYITRKPTDELDGHLSVAYGRFDKVRIEGAIGGPLSENVRVRLSGLYRRQDGHLINEFPEQTFIPADVQVSENLRLTDADIAAQPEGAGADLGGDETWAIRGQIEFDVGAISQLLVSGFYTETIASVGAYQSTPTIAQLNEFGGQINSFRVDPTETREVIGPGGIALNGAFDTNPNDVTRPVPGGDFFGYIDPDGDDFRTSSNFAFDDLNRYETIGATAKFSSNFDSGVNFTSVSDFKHHEKFQALDLEAGPVDQFWYFGQADIDSFTQEFRLDGEGTGFRWVAGLFYLNIDAKSVNGFGANATSVFGIPFDQPRLANLRTNSYAAFGQFEWDLSDAVTLVAGLRGTREIKDYDLDVISTVESNPLAFDFEPTFPRTLGAGGAFFLDQPFADRTSDTLYTGKAQLEWRPASDVLIYGGYSRGVKAGSFNSGGAGDLNGIQDEIPYDAETLNAYEIGFKSTIAGGLRLNGATYYYDYSNYQASRWTGLANLITNNDARVFGVELDFAASPFDNFEISGAAGYVDAKVKDILIGRVINPTGGPDIFEGTPTDVRPTFVPEWTLSGIARYTIDDIGDGSVTLQASANYQSDIFHNLSNFDSTRFDGRTIVDLKIGWADYEDKWAVDVFLQNAFDERYNIIGFDLSQICGCNEQAQGMPRQWGVSVRRSF